MGPKRDAGLGAKIDAEAALLARVASGDAGAARALVTALAPRLLAVSARLLVDRAEAEDVTQETMLRVWRMAGSWRTGEAKLATWAHRVAVNLCLDRLRRRGRSAPLEEAPEPVDAGARAGAALEAREDAEAVRDALAALPDRQRAAIVLAHYEERTNPEIAAALEVSVEAVESLLARGRRALKAALAPRRRELLE